MSLAADMAARFVSMGVIASGKVGSTSAFQVPTTGSSIVIRETGGTSPTFTHNTPTVPATTRPAVQVMVRAATPDLALALAQAAYAASIVRNTVLDGTYYLYTVPIQEPIDMGLDDNRLSKFAFNIRAEKRP